MFIDAELLLSDGQPINDAGTTDYSDGAIFLSVARNIAKGQPLHVVITVDENFASSAGTYITFSVITAVGPLLSDTPVVLIATPAINKNVLLAGRVPIVLTLPPLPASGGAQAYLGLKYGLDTGTTTAGKVTAFIAIDADTNF